MNTYRLVPLGGDCGVQLVDGRQNALDIAQEIANRETTRVVVDRVGDTSLEHYRVIEPASGQWT